MAETGERDKPCGDKKNRRYVTRMPNNLNSKRPNIPGQKAVKLGDINYNISSKKPESGFMCKRPFICVDSQSRRKDE